MTEPELLEYTRPAGLKDSLTKYHLDKLIAARYVDCDNDRYYITSKGRAYVVENDLG